MSLNWSNPINIGTDCLKISRLLKNIDHENRNAENFVKHLILKYKNSDGTGVKSDCDDIKKCIQSCSNGNSDNENT